MQEDYSESSLLEHATVSLIERDYEKGFIDKSLLGLEDVHSFLEAVASENFAGGVTGVHKDVVQEWARMVLPATLEEDDLEHLSIQMVNLATFSQASPGFVRFSQEMLEQYLLGKHFSRLLQNSPEVLVRELARQELPIDSLALTSS